MIALRQRRALLNPCATAPETVHPRFRSIATTTPYLTSTILTVNG